MDRVLADLGGSQQILKPFLTGEHWHAWPEHSRRQAVRTEYGIRWPDFSRWDLDRLRKPVVILAQSLTRLLLGAFLLPVLCSAFVMFSFVAFCANTKEKSRHNQPRVQNRMNQNNSSMPLSELIEAKTSGTVLSHLRKRGDSKHR